MDPESAKSGTDLVNSPRLRLYSTPGNKKKFTFSTFPARISSPAIQRLPTVVNPFEQHLADRFKEPIIHSPSLFQRPETPPQPSMHFEWTIDDVSSLAPANVEASEHQFVTSHDPDYEEKAQAAISSYFKESVIVPSPMDCPLRERKIVLRASSVLKETRRKTQTRDAACQSILTFPPVLPKEIETLLAPYFTFIQDQQQKTPGQDCDSTADYEARDASLRRKLFDVSVMTASDVDEQAVEIDLHCFSPPPTTPKSNSLKNTLQTRNFGSPLANQSLNISVSPVRRESFGCLSPISKPQHHLNSSLYRSTPEKQGTPQNMSVDDQEQIDWAELSYDEVISSTMTQSNIQRKGITPMRRTRVLGKNLSRSFSMISADEVVNSTETVKRKSVHFCRFDSGFNDGTTSELSKQDAVTYEQMMDISATV